MKKNISLRIAGIIIVLIFFFAGVLIGRQMHLPNSFRKIQDIDQNYPLINPLLGIETANQSNLYKPLQNKIIDYIGKQKMSPDINSIAVYIHNLNTANWMGINEEEKFIPGSLTKVLLMISYFKLAEADAGILNKKIYYDGSFDLNAFANFKPKKPIPPKRWYTIKNLIEGMVADSGNNTTYLLSKNLDANIFQKIASSLKIKFPNTAGFQDFMSPKTYSLVFRVLYNSTYLSKSMSNEALRILSESTFKYGLVAKLPRDIRIAHKFGEHFAPPTKEGEPPMKELHDCGIVYKPDDPYFICIMTKGNDYNAQAEAIADISRVRRF